MLTLPAVSESYWTRLAGLYTLLDSPLRPIEEDVRVMESMLKGWSAANPTVSPSALLLGATPALAQMQWPTGTRLIGADNSFGTVSSIWPGDVPGVRARVCADWTSLPVPPGSIHIAAGDGSLNCVRYPDSARAVCRTLQITLAENGLFIVRCYIRPEPTETPAQLFDAVYGGAVSTFNQFKFRLFLALSDDPQRGVPVDDAYRTWAAYVPNPARVAVITGWPLPEIETMDAYRGSSTVHVFPTLEVFRNLFDEFFEEQSSTTLPYPLGEHCRIFALSPRKPSNR